LFAFVAKAQVPSRILCHLCRERQKQNRAAQRTEGKKKARVSGRRTFKILKERKKHENNKQTNKQREMERRRRRRRKTTTNRCVCKGTAKEREQHQPGTKLTNHE
jgi:hypothetical protein